MYNIENSHGLCWTLLTGKTAFPCIDIVDCNFMCKDDVSTTLSLNLAYRKIGHILNTEFIRKQPDQYFFYEKSFHPEVGIMQIYGFFFLDMSMVVMYLIILIKEK